MKVRKYRYFMCDFETTVYEGQEKTEVWRSAVVELNTEKVVILHSIEETFEYLQSFKGNKMLFYHNLKFDGSFWVDFLIRSSGYKQRFEYENEAEFDTVFFKDKEMPIKSFKYTISDRGQWYNIIIRTPQGFIEIRDSLKLLPYSVKKLGEDFKTKHQKLEMEYTGYRYRGCEITDKEKEYIRNDVLVVKEALEIMFQEGHNKTTIGACCLSEFKRGYETNYYNNLFPNLAEMSLDKDLYGRANVDEYIRKSYKGGWCYVVKGKEKQIKENGLTADVNSLYPSMMTSESGNYYPVGEPRFWRGNYIPNFLQYQHTLLHPYYFFIRIRTRFYIKPNKLPFIQIKNTLSYLGTEYLETSDVYTDKAKGDFVKHKGEVIPTTVILTLTQTDYYLLLQHYTLEDFEILDGCYFDTEIGLFDIYINKYRKIKQESKGAVKGIRKLLLNNLYGKLRRSTNNSYKIRKMENNRVVFYDVHSETKKPGYIRIGSAITSYRRNFTINARQANYYGKDKPGFIYADTDSIHCDLPLEKMKGIKVDDKAFCCWKIENEWDYAFFSRQKTYIEHTIKKDGEPCKPFYLVKCRGMPQRSKELFIDSFSDEWKKHKDDYRENELKFLKKKRTLKDFDVGLKVPGKLRPVRIPGGQLLVETTYEMR
mgnify:CR=1 FL=1